MSVSIENNNPLLLPGHPEEVCICAFGRGNIGRVTSMGFHYTKENKGRFAIRVAGRFSTHDTMQVINHEDDCSWSWFYPNTLSPGARANWRAQPVVMCSNLPKTPPVAWLEKLANDKMVIVDYRKPLQGETIIVRRNPDGFTNRDPSDGPTIEGYSSVSNPYYCPGWNDFIVLPLSEYMKTLQNKTPDNSSEKESEKKEMNPMNIPIPTEDLLKKLNVELTGERRRPVNGELYLGQTGIGTFQGVVHNDGSPDMRWIVRRPKPVANRVDFTLNDDTKGIWNPTTPDRVEFYPHGVQIPLNRLKTMVESLNKVEYGPHKIESFTFGCQTFDLEQVQDFLETVEAEAAKLK